MYGKIRALLEQHQPLNAMQTADPRYVALKIEELHELWSLAHDAVHPPEEEDEPTIERGYDEMGLRMQCLQLATQVDLARLHASQDRQWNSDPVGLAEAYVLFLKGGKTDAADLGSL